MGIDMIDVSKIVITPEILKFISELDSFKSSWQFIAKISLERLSALKKIASIESIGSSTRIEGTQLSDQEIALFLKHLESKSFQTRDQQEVAGYALACEKIFSYYDQIPISENAIKEMHIWLLQHSTKDERHRGEYKKIPIRIEAFDSHGKSQGILFETVSPLETPIKMQELIAWTNEAFKEKYLHPLIIIGLFIVLFLAIHPFQDGNGRLSRLLTTWLLLKSGYSYVPYSSLESIIEANKNSYYLALQQTQKSWQKHQPDWNHWLHFFFNCMQRQKQHLEVKISKEKLLIKNLPDLSLQILKLLQDHGRLKIADIEAITKANRNNLKKNLGNLVRNQYIQMNGKNKGSYYHLF